MHLRPGASAGCALSLSGRGSTRRGIAAFSALLVPRANRAEDDYLAVVTAPAGRGRRTARWSESPIFVLFLLRAVIFLALTSVYPLARTFWLSFHSWFMNKPNTNPQWVGLGEYQATLADEVFRTSALNTALFGIGT